MLGIFAPSFVIMKEIKINNFINYKI